jgi:sec-independent protein translocase protein TatA
MIEGLLRPSHLLLVFVVAVFVFGPKKLPELGKGLAQGIRSF